MTIRHLSQSIAGLLRNNPVGTLDFVLDDKGNALSDDEARVRLNEMLAQGQKYLPTSDDCVGFNPVSGCPGHEPLTGRELCKAMLARGDTRISCLVGDYGEDTKPRDVTHVIRKFEDGFFHAKYNKWLHATPINNMGEPLTAKEVGL